ncbi:MAG: D-glycero-beta-D-manno-heptose 1-phosphate adenylyltransferase [Kiritimatiellae bacterium]|nr:D-glycero-beta-D-manno-heptose 1-phosphate adenylyltransferase [Kiritimatiellia bacterium]
MAGKVKSLAELGKAVRALKEAGKRVVWTNGCFDLLHVGHVRYLRQARKLGDVLIVGLNTDKSVRKIKGAKRPLVTGSRRAEVLSALESVDHIVLYDDARPDRLLRYLKPDIHVKGGDYALADIPEAAAVAEYGGKVVVLRQTRGASTTNLIRNIVRLYG